MFYFIFSSSKGSVYFFSFYGVYVNRIAFLSTSRGSPERTEEPLTSTSRRRKRKFTGHQPRANLTFIKIERCETKMLHRCEANKWWHWILWRLLRRRFRAGSLFHPLGPNCKSSHSFICNSSDQHSTASHWTTGLQIIYTNKLDTKWVHTLSHRGDKTYESGFHSLEKHIYTLNISIWCIAAVVSLKNL